MFHILPHALGRGQGSAPGTGVSAQAEGALQPPEASRTGHVTCGQMRPRAYGKGVRGTAFPGPVKR